MGNLHCVVLASLLVGCSSSAVNPDGGITPPPGLPSGTTGDGRALAEGTGATTPRSAGSAPADNVAFTGGFTAGTPGTVSFTLGGAARSVELYLPATLPTNPPLIITFHGTGGGSFDLLDDGLVAGAEDAGIILVGPQALMRNGGMGETGDPDHYPGSDGWGTSWNLGDKNRDTNNDIQFVRAIIQSARTTFNIDTDRVYVMGFSNGAFFSYFVAAMLPDRIAAFSENAGGAIRCMNRGLPGEQFKGTATTCGGLAMQTGFPTCMEELKPLPVPARIPLGYLAHGIDDDAVSVAWSCTLGTALGNRAWVFLQAPPTGGSFGHDITTDYSARSLAFFARYRRQD
ncbi:MAG: hypothetical protein JNK82_07885 [Myxococcaceae bacterium]|nr:hypothetical protein [Myxococcaceae bacterium]